MPNGEETGGGVQIPIEWTGLEQFGVDAQLINRALAGMYPGDKLGASFAQFETGIALAKSQITELAKTGRSSFALLETGFRNIAYMTGHGMALSRGLNVAKVAVEGLGLTLTAATIGAGLFAAGIVTTGIVLTKWGSEYGKYILQLEKINDVSQASSVQVQKLAQVYQLQGKSVADLSKELAAMEAKGIDPMNEGFERLAKSAGMTAPELAAAMGNLKGFVTYTPDVVSALKEQEDATNRLAVAWLNYKNNLGIPVGGIIASVKTAIAGILEESTMYKPRARMPYLLERRSVMSGWGEPEARPLGAGWGRDLGRWRGEAPDFQKRAETTAKWLAEQDKQMGARLDLTKSMTDATDEYSKSLEELNKQLQEAYVRGDKEAITKTGEQIKIVTEKRGKQQSEWILSMLKSTEGVSQKAVEQFMLGVGLTTQQQLDYYDKVKNLIKSGDIQGLIQMALKVPIISMVGAPAEKPRFWRPQDFPDIKGYREKIRAAQLARLEPFVPAPISAPLLEAPTEEERYGAAPTIGVKRAVQAPGINIDLYNQSLRGAKRLQSDLGNAALTDGQNIALGLQPALTVVDDIKQTYLDFINAPAFKTVTVTYISRYITEQVDLTP